MPSRTILEQFIACVERGAHDEAIARFYAPHASMRENQQPPRQGRELLIEYERRVLARARSIRSQCVAPVFVQGDRVVIRWIFEFDWFDGRHTRLEELAYQRWEGERIAEEEFFYEPAQLTQKEALAMALRPLASTSPRTHLGIQAPRAAAGGIPYLAMRGRAAAAAEFYGRAFGAELVTSLPLPDGQSGVMHAEIAINGGKLCMTDHRGPDGSASMNFGHLQLEVADGQASWDRAVAAGCKVVMPYERQFWGDDWGLLEDPFGVSWAVLQSNLQH